MDSSRPGSSFEGGLATIRRAEVVEGEVTITLPMKQQSVERSKPQVLFSSVTTGEGKGYDFGSHKGREIEGDRVIT